VVLEIQELREEEVGQEEPEPKELSVREYLFQLPEVQ
jgi:hypothetical protein